MNIKVMIVVIGIFLALSFGTSAPAAGPTDEGYGAAGWKALGPNGGNIPSIVVNPSNPSEAYAATTVDRGQVYRSTNGGSSWKRVWHYRDARKNFSFGRED